MGWGYNSEIEELKHELDSKYSNSADRSLSAVTVARRYPSHRSAKRLFLNFTVRHHCEKINEYLALPVILFQIGGAIDLVPTVLDLTQKSLLLRPSDSDMSDGNVTVASNVLGTIGTVLWCIQLIPQIWYNWKRKKTDGFPATMMFLWASCMCKSRGRS